MVFNYFFIYTEIRFDENTKIFEFFSIGNLQFQFTKLPYSLTLTETINIQNMKNVEKKKKIELLKFSFLLE